MARKNAATSSAPTRYVSSGGKVTMRHSDPRAGGSMACGKNCASRTRAICTGVASVTQMRVEAKPGRAGSVRTSGAGPSATARDLPLASSTVMMRRTGFGVSVIEFCAHYHEGHEAAGARVGPAVPVAELHHHVARLHHDLAAVEHERAFARQHDSIVHGLGLVA